MAMMAAPLYALLKKDVPFEWTSFHQMAFDKLKQAFAARLMLSPVDFTEKFQLYTDASTIALGGCLKQGDLIIDFYSYRLSPTEQRYPAHTLEALGLTKSILHFRRLLLGAKFDVYTNHKPLLQWMTRAPRQ